MAISVGDKLPTAELARVGADGPEAVDLGGKLDGRKVVIFGLPGAFTGTCTTAHVPSFIRNMNPLRDKGVDEVICVAVNDPFVMQAWAESTGAEAAGITMLADPQSAFTKALGQEMTVPFLGFFDRSKRYAMVVDNGIVTVLKDGDKPGQCSIAAAEALLDAM